jgi:hypothetical protein
MMRFYRYQLVMVVMDLRRCSHAVCLRKNNICLNPTFAPQSSNVVLLITGSIFKLMRAVQSSGGWSDNASAKPNFERRNTMKSGTRDEAESKRHEVKGKIKCQPMKTGHR